MGDEAGELDSYVRYLVMRLLNSLKGKALNYTKDVRDDSQVSRYCKVRAHMPLYVAELALIHTTTRIIRPRAIFS
jgi:hypothetical protein